MTQNLGDIKHICLDKWSEGSDLDSRLENFEKNFEEWIEQIPKENRETVLTLIQNMEYYTHQTTNIWLENLHKQLIKSPNISDENTVYAFIKSKDGKTNSSNDYWTEYKAINRINKNICFENLDVIDEEDLIYIKNFVFIDDFSGSGKSFIDELKKKPERYKGKNIYLITINIMYKAIEKINRYSKESGIHIITLSAFRQKKAFERGLFEDEDVAREEIRVMSEHLGIPKDDIMGKYKTQALIAFYNNTPNNTIGFIRYNTEQYKSIFPRRDDVVPGWLKMKKERKSRSRANYNNTVKDV